jgi:hypothetical protein
LPPAQANALVGQLYQDVVDKTGAAMLGFSFDDISDAGTIAGAPSTSMLDAGNFARFVTTDKLDLEIADLLRELDGYPADSWAKQTTAFAFHELDKGNLLGIFTAANAAKAKKVVPAAYHALLDAEAAAVGYGVTIAHIGGVGAYKGVVLISDKVVQDGTVAGSNREKLAEVLTHELTHFRNRDFFIALNASAPNDNAALYVSIAKANAHAGTPSTARFVTGEIFCNHVAWRVHQDLRNRSAGTAIATNPNKKGFFRYALALDGAGWQDNGYLADLKVAGDYNQQIALWLQKIGGEQGLFHEDAAKNTAVRQFFKDMFDAVKPAFTTPVEPEDGGV